MLPHTKYTKCGDVNIAYQVIGNGPVDIVYVPGWVSHLEYAWEEQSLTRFYKRLASFARLMLFDKRGTGLSDRVSAFPTLEERMDDVQAVMDAVGSERAVIFGMSEGGSMSALFAATHPERTVALIGFSIFAKRIWTPDYPWAPTREERQKYVDSIGENWGGSGDLNSLAPSVADNERFNNWWGSYLRYSASPGAAVALAKWNNEIDIRGILPNISVPTLILHRTNDAHVNIEEGRYIAAEIPRSKFVELPGDDHLVWVGDAELVVDEIEEFITGVRPSAGTHDRILSTVLFTDIVDSTKHATEKGDHQWKDCLDQHHRITLKNIAHFSGRAIKSTGDGFLATFDGPGRAIMCAASVRDEVRNIGIEIRAGLHTGEIELLSDDIGGIAVHIAARVIGEAGKSEVWVSGTVKDLVVGSGIQFSEKGTYNLKGVPGDWPLFIANE